MQQYTWLSSTQYLSTYLLVWFYVSVMISIFSTVYDPMSRYIYLSIIPYILQYYQYSLYTAYLYLDLVVIIYYYGTL